MMASDLVAEQQRQICELVYAALEAGQHGDAILTWFVAELKYPQEWSAFVYMALLDRNKHGELRWRVARRPFGLLSTITWRAAMKWRPELLFGTEIDLKAKARGQVSRPVKREQGDDDGDKFSADDLMENAAHHSAVAAGDYNWVDEERDWFDIEDNGGEIIASACRSMGFDSDECEVIVWRAVHKLSREAIKEFWEPRRAERVWRRVTEKMNAPDFRLRFIRELERTVEHYRKLYREGESGSGLRRHPTGTNQEDIKFDS